LVVALAIVIGALMPATAQEATPDASTAPNPELCTLEPVSIERIEQLLATPVAATAASEASMPAAEGEQVDEATQAAIEQAMIVNIACINTGWPLQQLAIYTEAGMRRIFGESIGLSEDVAALEAQNPTDESSWTRIYEFSPAVRLDGDRVAIEIVGDDPTNESAPSPTRFVLVERDGHWYIESFERLDA
jgi:hypothetical protein